MTDMHLDGFHTVLKNLHLAGSEFYVFAMMAVCSVPECGQCAVIMCPEEDPMHLHHDGCPACDVQDHSGRVILKLASVEQQREAVKSMFMPIMAVVK